MHVNMARFRLQPSRSKVYQIIPLQAYGILPECVERCQQVALCPEPEGLPLAGRLLSRLPHGIECRRLLLIHQLEQATCHLEKPHAWHVDETLCFCPADDSFMNEADTRKQVGNCFSCVAVLVMQ